MGNPGIRRCPPAGRRGDGKGPTRTGDPQPESSGAAGALIPFPALRAMEGERHMKTSVILCGHGSRSQSAVDDFAALADRLPPLLPPDWELEYGYMEFAKPVILDGLDRLREKGCGRILGVPGMLFAAMHAKNDIPTVLNTYAAKHGIEVRCGRELGVDPKLVAAAQLRNLRLPHPDSGRRGTGADQDSAQRAHCGDRSRRAEASGALGGPAADLRHVQIPRAGSRLRGGGRRRPGKPSPPCRGPGRERAGIERRRLHPVRLLLHRAVPDRERPPPS